VRVHAASAENQFKGEPADAVANTPRQIPADSTASSQARAAQQPRETLPQICGRSKLGLRTGQLRVRPSMTNTAGAPGARKEFTVARGVKASTRIKFLQWQWT